MNELDLLPRVDVEAFVHDVRGLGGIMGPLSETPFVPSGLRGNPAACVAAVMYGAGLGMDPMTSLRNIHVIEGQPSLSALAMLGLVLGQGHEVWVEEASDTRVIQRGRRRGSDKVQESVWTIQRAEKAGLAGRPNWKKYPQAMLMARARAELCRMIAPDVLMGCPYAYEELADGFVPGTPQDGQPVEKAATKPRNERRVMTRDPMPEPELPEPKAIAQEPAAPVATTPSFNNGPTVTPFRKTAPRAVEDAPVLDTVHSDPEPNPRAGESSLVPQEERIHDNTRRAVMATFGEAGIKDRNARMARVVEIIGRHVDSVNQLSEPEARLIIDTVKNGPAVRPRIPGRSSPAPKQSTPEPDSAYDWSDVSEGAPS